MDAGSSSTADSSARWCARQEAQEERRKTCTCEVRPATLRSATGSVAGVSLVRSSRRAAAIPTMQMAKSREITNDGRKSTKRGGSGDSRANAIETPLGLPRRSLKLPAGSQRRLFREVSGTVNEVASVADSLQNSLSRCLFPTTPFAPCNVRCSPSSAAWRIRASSCRFCY